jgi:large-conductance mechanosensitive channel
MKESTMSEKKSMVQEFKEFITTGDLMSVAVAFIMALAIKAVIDSFVKDIFTGVLGLFVKCEAILDGTGKKIARVSPARPTSRSAGATSSTT